MPAPKPIRLTSVAENPALTEPSPLVAVIPGFDPAKTQTLKNIEGVLTWVDDPTDGD